MDKGADSLISNSCPIGILDSGVGGLSVLRHIREQLPNESIIYFADQGHIPYGPRPATEIQQFSEGIVRYFLTQPVKLVVVACNTASAAALNHLRTTFPDLPIVGMEPAVKPGVAQTRTGKVGVLATAVTIESERYARLMTRYAADIELFQDPCRGLVELIEAGQEQSPDTAALLRRIVAPMLDAGVDTLVLGCTHYPFILPLLTDIVGPTVNIIDPAPAVIRQTRRVLEQSGWLHPGPATGERRALTTGDPQRLTTFIQRVLPPELLPLPVTAAHWESGRISERRG